MGIAASVDRIDVGSPFHGSKFKPLFKIFYKRPTSHLLIVIAALARRNGYYVRGDTLCHPLSGLRNVCFASLFHLEIFHLPRFRYPRHRRAHVLLAIS